MRSPLQDETSHVMVRPLEDDEVDRAEVEVRQRMELTATNRSRAWSEASSEADAE